jgi:hypothetical protein
MKWEDDDPPASDINTARLRAKYYGARYIFYRPLLHFALHQEASTVVDSPHYPGSQPGPQSQQVFPSLSHPQHTGMLRWPSDTSASGQSTDAAIYPGNTLDRLHPKVQKACKNCIDSAILSTEAFDGIKGRLIVTNIFGTAHA